MQMFFETSNFDGTLKDFPPMLLPEAISSHLFTAPRDQPCLGPLMMLQNQQLSTLAAAAAAAAAVVSADFHRKAGTPAKPSSSATPPHRMHHQSCLTLAAAAVSLLLLLLLLLLSLQTFTEGLVRLPGCFLSTRLHQVCHH
jgi:hypothetical protein